MDDVFGTSSFRDQGPRSLATPSQINPEIAREFPEQLIKAGIATSPSDAYTADLETLKAAGIVSPKVYLHIADTDEVVTGELYLVHEISTNPETGQMIEHDGMQIQLVAPVDGGPITQHSADGQYSTSCGRSLCIPLESVDLFSFDRKPFEFSAEGPDRQTEAHLKMLVSKGSLVRLEMEGQQGVFLEGRLVVAGISQSNDMNLWVSSGQLKTGDGRLAKTKTGSIYVDTDPSAGCTRYPAALFSRGCAIIPHEQQRFEPGLQFNFDTGRHHESGSEVSTTQSMVSLRMPAGLPGDNGRPSAVKRARPVEEQEEQY